jgi:flagellar biosynthesis/type III secretory pathway M-ring protein FliF/YscJ
MVRLTSIRTEIDPHTGKPKQPWWKLSKFGKINLFMGCSIVAGLWSFVIVRDHVMSERRNQMKLKKDLQTKVQKEIEEEGNKAGPNAKKYNL